MKINNLIVTRGNPLIDLLDFQYIITKRCEGKTKLLDNININNTYSSSQGVDIWLSVLQGQQLRELHDGVPQRVHLARNQRRQKKGK